MWSCLKKNPISISLAQFFRFSILRGHVLFAGSFVVTSRNVRHRSTAFTDSRRSRWTGIASYSGSSCSCKRKKVDLHLLVTNVVMRSRKEPKRWSDRFFRRYRVRRLFLASQFREVQVDLQDRVVRSVLQCRYRRHHEDQDYLAHPWPLPDREVQQYPVDQWDLARQADRSCPAHLRTKAWFSECKRLMPTISCQAIPCFKPPLQSYGTDVQNSYYLENQVFREDHDALVFRDQVVQGDLAVLWSILPCDLIRGHARLEKARIREQASANHLKRISGNLRAISQISIHDLCCIVAEPCKKASKFWSQTNGTPVGPCNPAGPGRPSLPRPGRPGGPLNLAVNSPSWSVFVKSLLPYQITY